MSTADPHDSVELGLQQCLVDADELISTGMFADAERLLLAAEQVAHEHNLEAHRARLIGTRALALHHRGDLAGAIQLHLEEASAFRRLRDTRGLAVSLGNLAAIHREVGAWASASELLREQEKLCETLGDAVLLIPCLGNQATLWLDRGELSRARELFSRVLDLAKETDNAIAYATTLLNLGNLFHARAEDRKAEEFFHDAEQLSRAIGWTPGLVKARMLRAQLPQDDVASAESEVLEALNFAHMHNLVEFDEIAREVLDRRHGEPSRLSPADAALPASDLARRLYEDVQISATWFGARPGFEPASVARISSVRERIRVILSQVTKVTDTVYECPSPWHAAIQLLQLQDRSLSESAVHREAMVFRGQGDCRWPLVASIGRPGADAALEARRLEAFSAVLTRFFELEASSNADIVAIEANTPAAHTAAAQHYGIKTHLLDFTLDPCVAVAFANQSRAGSLAVVYAVPFDLARRTGLIVVLPHPYFSRLYQQRGLFIDTRQDFTPESLGSNCVEVRFPPADGFLAYRDRQPVELLTDDPFFDGVVYEVRRLVASVDAPPLDAKTSDAIIASPGGVPMKVDREQRRQAISDGFREFWHALRALVVLNHTDGRHSYDGGALCEFAKANRPILSALGRVYRIAMAVISHVEADFQTDPVNETLARLLLAFAAPPRSPGPQDFASAWQIVRSVPDWALAAVVTEFYDNGARIQIQDMDDAEWLLTVTRLVATKP